MTITDQQWKIDRADAQRSSNPAADLTKPLTVPGLLWSDPNRALHGWRPTTAPVVESDPRDVWRAQQAEALRDEVAARADHGLIEAAQQALGASAAALAALHTLEQQKRDDQADTSETAALRLLLADKRIDTARQQAERASADATAAVERVRLELTRIFDATIREREWQIARSQDEQAAELERQAGDRRMAVVMARGALENYLLTPAAPVAAPADAPKPKRRLFG